MLRSNNILIAAIGALTVAGFAAPASADVFDDWDADSDGYIMPNEWDAPYQASERVKDAFYERDNGMMPRPVFDENLKVIVQEDSADNSRELSYLNHMDELDGIDINKDDFVTTQEFSQGIYNVYDANDDGRLDKDEFGTYVADDRF